MDTPGVAASTLQPPVTPTLGADGFGPRVPVHAEERPQPAATWQPSLACYGEDVISKITRYSCLIIPLYRSHFRRRARVM